MSAPGACAIVDTTLRDGSHSVAHRFTPEQVRRVAELLDRAGVWAIAVGHGDGLGAALAPVRLPAARRRRAAAAAAGVVDARADRGRAAARDRHQARPRGARTTPAPRVVRVSTVCTEADIGVQHLGLARELGMERAQPSEHGAHRLARAGSSRRRGSSSTPAARRSTSSTRPARSCPTTCAGGSRRCARRCPTTSRSASTSTTTSRSRSPTASRRSRRARRSSTSTLAGIGAGAGQLPGGGAGRGARAAGHRDRRRPLRDPGRRRRRTCGPSSCRGRSWSTA